LDLPPPQRKEGFVRRFFEKRKRKRRLLFWGAFAALCAFQILLLGLTFASVVSSTSNTGPDFALYKNTKFK
jgi:hypothetical protein